MRYEVRYVEETGCYAVIDGISEKNSMEPFRAEGPAKHRAQLENERWRCFLDTTTRFGRTDAS